jgi:predicted TIM-barrel fold metal-dependent hydrolase
MLADIDWRDLDAISERNRTLGGLKSHYDPESRLTDLDHEGIAAEVLFFGSQNGEWLPFEGFPLAEAIMPGMMPKASLEQQAAGYRIYNRWLADFCSVAPERFVGLAYVPFWEFDLAVKEMEWASEHGLRGVNFITLREGIPAFNDHVWDRIWAASVDLDLPLSTHAGGAEMPGVTTVVGPDSIPIIGSIDQQWFSRRGVWWMVCSGVFERFPKLKVALTEIPGVSWGAVADEMDGVYGAKASGMVRLISKKPSEYLSTNCYFGLSFASQKDVGLAIERGWNDTFMWGADFPHVEGTWGYTTLSLNKAFEGVEEGLVRKITASNAIELYNLNAEVLTPLVEQIGPTMQEITKPFDPASIPASSEAGMAFRDGAYMS